MDKPKADRGTKLPVAPSQRGNNASEISRAAEFGLLSIAAEVHRSERAAKAKSTKGRAVSKEEVASQQPLNSHSNNNDVLARLQELEALLEAERQEKEKYKKEKEAERQEKEKYKKQAEQERAHAEKFKRKADELKEQLDVALQKEEELFIIAEKANQSNWERFEDVLREKQPPILKSLAQPSQMEYVPKIISAPSSSNSKKIITVSSAGLTRVHPPQYATLLKQRDPTKEERSKGVVTDPKKLFSEFRKVTVRNKAYIIYQHHDTGLLLSTPPDTWPEPGVYESCLREWDIPRFRNHLMTAESAVLIVGEEECQIYSKVMDVHLNDMLKEFALGEYDFPRIESENEMQLSIAKTVFFFLEKLFKKAIGNDELKFFINTGSEGDNHPSLSKIRILDITYDITYKGQLLLRIVQENKAPFKFPCFRGDIKKCDERSILDSLIEFYSSNTGRASYADKNALMQLRLYLGIHHRCFGIVCSLNCWTFVKVENDGTMYVSKRFMANENDPSLKMGLLEVLIRFICAAIGNQKENNRFGVMEQRPIFVADWATAIFGKDQDHDYSVLRPNKEEDESSEDENNDGGANGEEERGGDNGRSKGRNGNNPSSSSSSAKGAASKDHTSASTSNSNTRGRKASLKIPGPRCWADLEDPRRNSPNSNLTFEQHMSPLGTLECDAVHIGTGRTGWVLRKTFDGIDMAIKLLCPRRHPDGDDSSFEALSAELENEERIYKKLESLQGDVVPRFFGWRWLGALDIEALVTEYVGPSLTKDGDGKILSSQAESALRALKKIHKEGVLHGDVDNLGNILWSESKKCAMFIDFAFGRCREDFKSEESWLKAIEQEEQDLCNILGLEQTQIASAVLPGTSNEMVAKRKGEKTPISRKGKRNAHECVSPHSTQQKQCVKKRSRKAGKGFH